ncbi:hypothetical protein B0H66DRAFT_512404 [Apodospora peruviana]|uniref:Short-chain dehydrogenase/reductase family protein n=1 Tax=Apodospora peruviana TaxID=516989 RepID=A0AAE0MBA3_9PEZI|nr:hypothetical protein B0H66DRAFT_512404 [Apodospora peruviana]
MSSKLEKQAASQAKILSNVGRQITRRVPPIPAGIDLMGKTTLVTGSNVGLGLECARHFLSLRASLLIMAVRSLEKGEAAAANLRAEFPDAKIEVWHLDMESLRSVQVFAARCNKSLDRIHVAVLNAALGKFRFERVAEEPRHEVTLQVNYLSTALLGLLLLPKLKASSADGQPGRLTFITSDSSLGADVKDPGDGTSLLDSLQRADPYSGLEQYATSKLLITMFAARLAEEVNPEEVIVNSCNPGATRGTAFLGNMESWAMRMAFHIFFAIAGRRVVDAARTYVYASVILGKESHGSYMDWEIRAWPVTMYTEHGRHMSDKLWSEILKEFRLAVGDEVIAGLGHLSHLGVGNWNFKV